MIARGYSVTISAVSNEEKQRVWDAYHDRKPVRVPLRFTTNQRLYILDPTLNTEGHSFADALAEPAVHLETMLAYQRYLRTDFNRYCDSPTGIPEEWEAPLNIQNVCDAGYFGAEVYCKPGQVPATDPILTEDTRESIFDIDIDHPLANPFVRHWTEFRDQMAQIAKGMTFEGRPVRVPAWVPAGTSGVVTTACDLRGTDFLIDLGDDGDYSDRLLDFLTEAAIKRRHAFWDHYGDEVDRSVISLADDSIAMLSPQMYVERVLPLHRRHYDAAGNDAPRSIHLCGDATHLFPIIHKELNVTSFDTGFPVDFAKLRAELGPDVEISGGVEVPLIMNGTADQVYERSKEILLSGIKEGGRFIFQEGNNLPPCAPVANLATMYEACREFGRY